MYLLSPTIITIIKKCSSPTGDGNLLKKWNKMVEIIIKKCSSPTGDGNDIWNIIYFEITIKKCSSPTGDGNEVSGSVYRLSFMSY